MAGVLSLRFAPLGRGIGRGGKAYTQCHRPRGEKFRVTEFASRAKLGIPSVFRPTPSMSQPIQFLLRAEEMPTHWYNLQADYPEPLPPPLHPGTKQPISPDMMAPLFPETLVAQEMSTERLIEIP